MIVIAIYCSHPIICEHRRHLRMDDFSFGIEHRAEASPRLEIKTYQSPTRLAGPSHTISFATSSSPKTSHLNRAIDCEGETMDRFHARVAAANRYVALFPPPLLLRVNTSCRH